MNAKRRRKDNFLKGITYSSSMLSFLILASIFLFVFIQGLPNLNFKLLKDDYWSTNYVVQLQDPKPSSFSAPDSLSSGAVFSSKWGIAVVSHTVNDKQMLLLEYVDENSPFAKTHKYSDGSPVTLEVGVQVERISVNVEGDIAFAGNIVNQDATSFIETLDSGDSISSVFVKTVGGGIRGSIISTLLLIGMTMVLALPIGVFAAIYLNEYKLNGKVVRLLRSAIELLSGIPSIIFGLVGVSVLYPITAFMGITTTSVLLGSLTLTMMLLPVIIKSTEEALHNVPQDLKDASLALGATSAQTIFKVVIPKALPGIISGAILGVGRVIGESAALIYTMGTFVSDSPSISSQGTSLAVHIWSIMSGENPNIALATTIALVIMIIVCILNVSVKLIMRKFQKGK